MTTALPLPMVSACGVLPPPLSKYADGRCFTYWMTTVAAFWPVVVLLGAGLRPLRDTAYRPVRLR